MHSNESTHRKSGHLELEQVPITTKIQRQKTTSRPTRRRKGPHRLRLEVLWNQVVHPKEHMFVIQKLHPGSRITQWYVAQFYMEYMDEEYSKNNFRYQMKCWCPHYKGEHTRLLKYLWCWLDIRYMFNTSTFGSYTPFKQGKMVKVP